MTDPETAPAHWDTLRFTQVNGRGLEWFWSNHVVRVERGREEKGLGSSKNRWLPCFPVLQGLTSLEPPVMTPPEPSTTESPEPPVTTSPKPPITTSPGAIPEQASTRSPRGPGLVPRNSSTRPCLPEIHQLSAAGSLELLCEVVCGPGVAVRWTRAPGGLAAYETQEVGARAWLSGGSVLWARCHGEGWFQCGLDPGGQTANLYVASEICEFRGWGGHWGSLRGKGALSLALDKGGPASLCPQLSSGLP